MLWLLAVVVLFHVANARAARTVGDRWATDTSVRGPRLALVLALDAVLVLAFAIARGGAWAAIALLPVAATIVMVILRSRRTIGAR